MYASHDPKWLRYLSRRLSWLAVPNIAVIFVSLQILGFLSVLTDRIWIERLALLPERVLQGEIWRLITFLALPISMSPLWMIFALLFMYFIINAIEEMWGPFKTTFYFLVSIVLTIVFSLVTGYPVTEASDFSSTLFLAAATLFPNYEIRLYFFIPVKMKVLGWIAMAFVVLRMLQGSWMDRLFLVTIYSNYLLFFGPTLIYQLREWKRRREFRAKWR
jgi:membrane associated rhomboid family serine protease